MVDTYNKNNIVKVGISGGKLNKNGSSKRAFSSKEMEW
ncbi:hypothetical protein [Virgibacillus proomii]